MTALIEENWTNVVTTLFGVTLALGFQKLEGALRQSWQVSKKCFAGHIYVGLCLSAFVIYDVTVYSLLIVKWPYTQTLVGGFRFALDVVMAFGLYVILRRGFGGNVWNCFGELSAALSLWHVAAVMWHVASSAERSLYPDLRTVLTHLSYSAVYAALLIWHQVSLKKPKLHSTADASRFQRRSLIGLASVVLCVSITRTLQVLAKL